jgi:hemin uptake protein HemP
MTSPASRRQQSPHDRTSARTGGAPGLALPLRVDARALLGTAGELVIDHDGREYRLRFTRNGRLILTA